MLLVAFEAQSNRCRKFLNVLPQESMMGTDSEALTRMTRMFEQQDLMLRKEQARDGVGLYPTRLLEEEIGRRRTPIERERGWINDYKAGTQPKKSFQYMAEQLVLSRNILGREPDNPQTFISSLNNQKGKQDFRMQGRERGWTKNTYEKERVNETLYGMTRPAVQSSQHSQLQSHAEFKFLENKKLENNRKLEKAWVSFGREQGRGRTGSRGALGRPRGLTASELRYLQRATAEKQDRERTTRGIPDKSVLSHGRKSSSSRVNMDGQQQSRRQYHTRLVVPVGTLERSGFGTASYRASITPEGQRDKYNQLVETGWVHRYDAGQGHWQASESGKERSDEDILKQGIEKEEEEGWMSSYRRKQKKEMCRLAKQRDRTASEVLKESYYKYREGGWINPLQRQKPSVYGSDSRHKGGKTAAEVIRSASLG